MKRLQSLLIIIIALEALLGSWFVYRRISRLRPPLPPVEVADPVQYSDFEKLAEHCHSAENWAELAELYQASGFQPESEACYREAVELAPRNAEYLYQWAFCLSRLGRTEEAIQHYKDSLSAGHPKPDWCWFFIGRNYLHEEKPELAREAFRKARELVAARFELARLELKTGNPAEANNLLQPVLGKYPDSLHPLYLGYRIEKELGNDQAAAKFADRAERARQRLPNPFDRDWERINQASWKIGLQKGWKAVKDLVDQGNTEEAEKGILELQKIRWEIHGEDLLAEFALQRGQATKALDHLQKIIDRDGPTLNALYRLGDTYEVTGQYDKARDTWEWATRIYSGPETKDLYFKLAMYHEKRGHKDVSQTMLAKGYQLLGEEAFWIGDLDRAQVMIKKALEYPPKLPSSYYYLGEICRLQGNQKGARDAYRQCLRLNPNHGRALDHLALLSAKKQ
ncbi:MAG: tetratricopeptide repeat protein [Bdellovibrionales bacterium]